jgi:GNAT superfamily N-acetyltransferase
VNALERPVRVAVREATMEDLRAVLELYAQPELDDGNTLSLEEAEAVFDRMRAYPDYRLYVAEVNGRVIGTYTLLVAQGLGHQGAFTGLVEAVAVDPDWHSRGVGAQMMRHALAYCRRRGCYKMALSSNLHRERAHAFYESLGFARHGYSFKVAP